MHMLDPVTPSRSSDSLVRRAAAAGTDHLPDLLLVERARAGEEQAIAALIRRYGRRLYRVARSVVPDAERAELIVQEACLVAFGDLSRYEPTGKFAAWLTRLTYQHAHAQRGAARPSTAPQPGPLAGAEDTLERRQVEHAISALPEVFRTSSYCGSSRASAASRPPPASLSTRPRCARGCIAPSAGSPRPLCSTFAACRRSWNCRRCASNSCCSRC